jgi:hypothetical protein
MECFIAKGYAKKSGARYQLISPETDFYDFKQSLC